MIVLVFLIDPYKLAFREANTTKHNVFCLCFRCLRNRLHDASGGFNWKTNKVQLGKTRLYRTIVYEIILTFLICGIFFY